MTVTRDAEEPWVRQRVEAAVALAGGNAERAGQLARQALAAVRAATPCGAYEYEARLLQGLLEEAVSPAAIPC